MVFRVPGISTLGFSGKRFYVEQGGLQIPFSEELKTWNVTWTIIIGLFYRSDSRKNMSHTMPGIFTTTSDYYGPPALPA